MDSTQLEARGDDQSVVSSEPVTPLPQGDWQPVHRYPELTAAPHFTIFNYRETDLLQQVDFRIGRNVAIRSVDSLYSTKLYHTLMILYLVCFISEYLLGFLQLPFEYVKNRPVMCIINAIFDVIVFAVSVVAYIVSAAVIPNRASYFAHLISVGVQFLSFVLNLVTFVLVFLSKEPFLNYAEANLPPSDYTGYVKVITSISLFISTCAL